MWDIREDLGMVVEYVYVGSRIGIGCKDRCGAR
jgi:hypothetical protein